MFLLGLVNIVKTCGHGATNAAGGRLKLFLAALGAVGMVVLLVGGYGAYGAADAALAGARDASYEMNVAATWLLVTLIGCAAIVGSGWALYRIRQRPAEDAAAAISEAQVRAALADASRRQLAQQRTTIGSDTPRPRLRVVGGRADRLEPARRRRIGA